MRGMSIRKGSRFAFVGVLLALLVSGDASASIVFAGARNIEKVFCYPAVTIYCYVDIDGANGGPAGCQSTAVRLDMTANYAREVFSLALAAHMADRQVTMYVDDACSGSYPLLYRLDVL